MRIAECGVKYRSQESEYRIQNSGDRNHEIEGVRSKVKGRRANNRSS